MCLAAFPSPNGDLNGSVWGWFSVLCISLIIASLFVPTSFANPAWMASGLSVDVLRMSTGFLIMGEVASSWIPPESVRMSSQFFISLRKSK